MPKSSNFIFKQAYLFGAPEFWCGHICKLQNSVSQKYTWLRDIMHQQAKIKKQSKGFFSRSIALSLCHLSLRGNQVIGSAFLVFLCFLLKKQNKKMSISDLTLSNFAMMVGCPVPPPSHPLWKWKMEVLISDKWPQMFTYQRKATGHQRETSFQAKSSNCKS